MRDLRQKRRRLGVRIAKSANSLEMCRGMQKHRQIRIRPGVNED